MSDTEREQVGRWLLRIRRIGARAEAIACGYRTADMATLGDDSAARAELVAQIRELAVESGAVEIKKG
jgi:hypothetical protein